MPTITEDRKFKNALKDTLTDLIKSKPDLLRRIIVEAIEDAAFANAIKEGRKGNFVEEANIKALLKG